MAPTIGVNLRVTGHCNQGGRKYMEDMFSVAYQQTADELDLEYAYFGIFDGHGGHEAATFAKEHLMKAIVSQSGFWSDNDEDVLRAIKDGFIATHYAMWRNLENWPKTQSGLPSTSGTTASIAFIRRSNIYIGHVGDSCIVLGYQDPCSDHWRGAALTEDHKPESPMEHERINQAGGQVICKAGVPRVVWQRPRIAHKGPLTRSTHIDQIPFLAVARSLGDLWSYNADSDRFVVSPEPDVFVHHIDLSRDRCLIFGTDGLWNMLSPNEAVGIVEKAESNNKNSGNDRQDQAWQNPSKCLVDSAITKWTDSRLRADNTSAVTLLLDPLGPPHSQVLDQQNAATQTESEFVPYHIESYKVNNEGKSPSMLSSQTSGLAICTWYPHKNVPENLNKNAGMTTLKTMEQLFGEKVEIYDASNDKNMKENEKNDEKTKEAEVKSEIIEPSTSKTCAEEPDVKKSPQSYSSVLRNAHRNNGHHNKTEEKEKCKVSSKENTKDLDNENNKEEIKRGDDLTSDENQNQEVDENVNKMRLRGSPYSKEPERSSIEVSLSKNCQKGIPLTKTLKQNKRRGKKRKNYEVLRSQLNLFADTKILRSKNKRRHSSLVETISLMYEPGPKRRTKSEDQRKIYECEDYKSDTENKVEDVLNKTRRIKKKMRTPEPSKEKPETSGESTRLNHLQERLQNNSNNDADNQDNTPNNSNNTSNCSSSNSNIHNNTHNNNHNHSNNNSLQGFTPMRLRSNMPVKTLRSRNVNLENCDWFLVDLPKINVHQNRKSISKQQHFKSEDLADSANKSLTKISSVHTRNSLNSSKVQLSEPSPRATVHTRSQNKRLKK